MATTQTREAEVIDAVPKQLLIGGEWRDAGGGETLAVEERSRPRGYALREHALKHFTWEWASKRIVDLYQTCLQSGRAVVPLPRPRA